MQASFPLMNVSTYALSDRHEVLFVPTPYQIIATIIKGYSQEASECAFGCTSYTIVKHYLAQETLLYLTFFYLAYLSLVVHLKYWLKKFNECFLKYLGVKNSRKFKNWSKYTYCITAIFQEKILFYNLQPIILIMHE